MKLLCMHDAIFASQGSDLRFSRILVRLGYCFTPYDYQRLRLYNGAPFRRLLRNAGDTEDVFSSLTPGVFTGALLSEADRNLG